MKKLIFLSVLVAAVLFLAPSADAATAKNKKTGYKSFNISEVKNSNKVGVLNLQGGVVINSTVAGTSTGNNSADKNTGNGTVNAGSAKTTVKNETDLNSSTIRVTQEPCDCAGSEAVNKKTGAKSVNIAKVENENSVFVGQAQLGLVVNETVAGASTGGNSADKNTGNGSVTTEDATTKVVNQNTVNSSTIVVTQ